MTLTEFLLARIAEDDFAKYGCDGTGEYSRCHHMSERYERAVEAMRRIVDQLAMTQPPASDADYVVEQELEMTLMYLAAVYSDHPDYRDEWRP